MFVVADKVQAFKRKLALWTKRAQEKRMDMFLLLSDILESSPQVNISDSVSQHLSQLAEKFDDYSPEDPREGHMWILDPFSVDPTANDVALPSHLESQLLEVSTDSTLKLQWGKLDLGSFWVAVSKEYPCLALRAVKLLLPFTTTYLCESGFSILATTKDQSPKQTQSNAGGYSESEPFPHSTQTGSDCVSEAGPSVSLRGEDKGEGKGGEDKKEHERIYVRWVKARPLSRDGITSE
ncbi:Zinc finger BED domain-containing protein 5 Transposon-derived Buster1 transposase-like protein [Larimichthys crocea]|uniref:Zinc finger BED domain-containing protein 5 Transposon-derived Buster1 transposase-like protein n=1 Tax=Larimichthys crocea TaxID=215358 RepID=A0A6G0HLQ7_LARCR|nr:Zinc finger BED domain-containing protein 5 Transposon-derived Buster1 transposase-like protein [Larimichthys crocea]